MKAARRASRDGGAATAIGRAPPGWRRRCRRSRCPSAPRASAGGRARPRPHFRAPTTRPWRQAPTPARRRPVRSGPSRYDGRSGSFFAAAPHQAVEQVDDIGRRAVTGLSVPVVSVRWRGGGVDRRGRDPRRDRPRHRHRTLPLPLPLPSAIASTLPIAVPSTIAPFTLPCRNRRLRSCRGRWRRYRRRSPSPVPTVGLWRRRDRRWRTCADVDDVSRPLHPRRGRLRQRGTT